MINWELSKQDIRWLVSPDRIQVEYFFEVIRWQVTSFQTIASSFLLCLCHYGPALLTFWFQTDLGRENSASYLKMQAGKTDTFHFPHHSHALVTLHVQFLCYDWSNFDSILQHLATCLLCQPQLTEFCVNLWCFYLSFSTGCTKWNTTAIKGILLFMAGLFTEFLVEKCAACQSRKSDFRWHPFCFSPCWMRKRINI